MSSLQKVVGYLLLAGQALLLFLVLFQEKIVLPVWLQIAGRLHPLVLHLPIGLLLLLVLIQFFRSDFKRKAFARMERMILTITAAFTTLTALAGLFLSVEGGYDENSLWKHLNTGTLLSFFTWGMLLIRSTWPQAQKPFIATLGLSTLLVILTGHFGANLTHGDGYLLEPLSRTADPLVLTDSTSLYDAAIQPIFNQKCISCHNERKAKGGLVMTSVAAAQRGGDNGPIWKADQADSSEIVRRLRLSIDHDDHMPPNGKTQLTSNEISLIISWVGLGADATRPWTKYADSLRSLLSLAQEPAAARTRYSFPQVDDATLNSLNTPYLTVQPVATETSALSASFFIADQFKADQLRELLQVKEQLIQLNLNGMPVTDGDIGTLNEFVHLEKLALNNTKVTVQGLQQLQALKKLQSLSLNGLTMDVPTIEQFATLPEMRTLFVWNTPLTDADLAPLRSRFPNINFVTGYEPRETLRLTPPLLVNESFLLKSEEGVSLKHNLPGVEIRYTVNGEEPDSSIATVYQKPVAIKEYTIIKARAVKSGWFASPVVTFPFFVQGITPARATLLTQPDKDYRAEGAGTLTNLKKGDPDNYRDNQWLGFRHTDAVAVFEFEKATSVRQVTISYNRNIGSYLMPPERVEIWAGQNANALSRVAVQTPPQPIQYEPTRGLGLVIPLNGKSYSIIKIVLRPVSKLPKWHSGKGEKGWVFWDEVIFQ